LSLNFIDTKAYAPQIRARLVSTAKLCTVVVLKQGCPPLCWLVYGPAGTSRGEGSGFGIISEPRKTGATAVIARTQGESLRLSAFRQIHPQPSTLNP
jgi:hypothetical protein